MARTERLPIYESAYDLCLYIEQIVHGFSRYHKYTLEADLTGRGPAGLEVGGAGQCPAREDTRAAALRETLEELKVLLRLGQDVKAFGNFNAFAQAMTQVGGHRQAASVGRVPAPFVRVQPRMTA